MEAMAPLVPRPPPGLPSSGAEVCAAPSGVPSALPAPRRTNSGRVKEWNLSVARRSMILCRDEAAARLAVHEARRDEAEALLTRAVALVLVAHQRAQRSHAGSRSVLQEEHSLRHVGEAAEASCFLGVAAAARAEEARLRAVADEVSGRAEVERDQAHTRLALDITLSRYTAERVLGDPAHRELCAARLRRQQASEGAAATQPAEVPCEEDYGRGAIDRECCAAATLEPLVAYEETLVRRSIEWACFEGERALLGGMHGVEATRVVLEGEESDWQMMVEAHDCFVGLLLWRAVNAEDRARMGIEGAESLMFALLVEEARYPPPALPTTPTMATAAATLEQSDGSSADMQPQEISNALDFVCGPLTADADASQDPLAGYALRALYVSSLGAQPCAPFPPLVSSRDSGGGGGSGSVRSSAQNSKEESGPGTAEQRSEGQDDEYAEGHAAMYSQAESPRKCIALDEGSFDRSPSHSLVPSLPSFNRCPSPTKEWGGCPDTTSPSTAALYEGASDCERVHSFKPANRTLSFSGGGAQSPTRGITAASFPTADAGAPPLSPHKKMRRNHSGQHQPSPSRRCEPQHVNPFSPNGLPLGSTSASPALRSSPCRSISPHGGGNTPRGRRSGSATPRGHRGTDVIKFADATAELDSSPIMHAPNTRMFSGASFDQDLFNSPPTSTLPGSASFCGADAYGSPASLAAMSPAGSFLLTRAPTVAMLSHHQDHQRQQQQRSQQRQSPAASPPRGRAPVHPATAALSAAGTSPQHSLYPPCYGTPASYQTESQEATEEIRALIVDTDDEDDDHGDDVDTDAADGGPQTPEERELSAAAADAYNTPPQTPRSLSERRDSVVPETPAKTPMSRQGSPRRSSSQYACASPARSQQWRREAASEAGSAEDADVEDVDSDGESDDDLAAAGCDLRRGRMHEFRFWGMKEDCGVEEARRRGLSWGSGAAMMFEDDLSCIYKVRRKLDGMLYCVIVMKESVTAENQAKLLLTVEALVATQMNGVRYVDCWKEPKCTKSGAEVSKLCILTELMFPATLIRRRELRKITQAQLVSIGQSIETSIQALHQQNIVHTYVSLDSIVATSLQENNIDLRLGMHHRCEKFNPPRRRGVRTKSGAQRLMERRDYFLLALSLLELLEANPFAEEGTSSSESAEGMEGSSCSPALSSERARSRDPAPFVEPFVLDEVAEARTDDGDDEDEDDEDDDDFEQSRFCALREAPIFYHSYEEGTSEAEWQAFMATCLEKLVQYSQTVRPLHTPLLAHLLHLIDPSGAGLVDDDDEEKGGPRACEGGVQAYAKLLASELSTLESQYDENGNVRGPVSQVGSGSVAKAPSNTGGTRPAILSPDDGHMTLCNTMKSVQFDLSSTTLGKTIGHCDLSTTYGDLHANTLPVGHHALGFYEDDLMSDC